jgi:type I restriction enzyme, S subunit
MTDKVRPRIPLLRFKGFESTWAIQPLGGLCDEFHSGRFISASEITEIGEYPVYGGNGLRGFAVKYSHDGFYALIGRQGAQCGNVNLSSGRAFFTEHAVAVRANKNSETLFLYYLLGTMALGQYSSQSAQPGLAVNKLRELRSFVCDINEQTQIGTYLRELDQLIDLHQRKQEKLLTLKKAMLQKMFPQAGAAAPEIRFKGFEVDWEGKILNELMPITSAARVLKSEWARSGIPFFRTSDVVALYKGEKTESVFISLALYERLSDKIGRIKAGDILITGGGSIGIPFLAQSDEPLYFKDADLLWLKVPANVDSAFLYVFFTSDFFREYIKSISHVGTIGHYTVDQAKNTPISLPRKNEQQKIGSYFRKLDELISKHAIQIQKLKQIKSACLEKMFV